MTHHRSRQAGITLIEVLVSLAIFAIIGLAGLTVLNSVTTAGAQTEGRLERLAEIDRAFLLIKRDLVQTKPLSTQLNNNRLTLQRPHQQNTITVTYDLQKDALTRTIENPNTKPTQQKILSNVTNIKWSLLSPANQWADLWPQDQTQPQRPRAAELQINLLHHKMQKPQTLTRLFVLPNGTSK